MPLSQAARGLSKVNSNHPRTNNLFPPSSDLDQRRAGSGRGRVSKTNPAQGLTLEPWKPLSVYSGNFELDQQSSTFPPSTSPGPSAGTASRAIEACNDLTCPCAEGSRREQAARYRWHKALSVAVSMLMLAACEHAPLPGPRIPQLLKEIQSIRPSTPCSSGAPHGSW